ncbi:FAD-binding protein, partial [Amycolatopsis mediterranei]
MDALVADVVIVGFGAAGACAALEAADAGADVIVVER